MHYNISYILTLCNIFLNSQKHREKLNYLKGLNRL